MARGRRGGVRAGNPGTQYTNRTDLNRTHSLPVTAVPGQTYGARVQQQNAQRMTPMAPPPAIGAPTGGAASGAAAPSPAGGSFLAPGQLPPLDRPTERPNEPVTAGAKLGPGPGPEVLPNGGMMTGGAMSFMLNRAASAAGSSALRTLAIQAQQQGK